MNDGPANGKPINVGPEPIDVMTLNLWGRNGPVERRMRELADHLGGDRPDVLALQEVEAVGDTSQADWLAGRLDYATVLEIDTGRWGWPGEGLAVLTDLEARPLRPVDLPHGLDAHPRRLQQIAIGDVRIANTHLAFRLDQTELRVSQARLITEEVGTGPAVLAGDLNDSPGSRPLQILTSDGFEDCFAAAGRPEQWTFDPANPYATSEELLRRRVDHVLVRGLTVVDAAVELDGRHGPVVSDHYAVRARLRRDEP